LPRADVAGLIQTAQFAGSNGYGQFSLSPTGEWTYTIADSLLPVLGQGLDSLSLTTAEGVHKQITVAWTSREWGDGHTMVSLAGSATTVHLLVNAQARAPSELASGLGLSILTSSLHDSRSVAAHGVALTGLDSRALLWVSTNAGSSWQSVSASDFAGRVLLLKDDGSTRFAVMGASGFVTDTAGLSAALSFRAWDVLSGQASGSWASAPVATGAGTAFGALSNTLTLVVMDSLVPRMKTAVISGADAFGVAKSSTLVQGDVIKVVLTSSETLIGLAYGDKVVLTMGASDVNALYVGSSGNAHTFSYTVAKDDVDIDGVALKSLSVGSVKNVTNVALSMALPPSSSISSPVNVDAKVPVLQSAVSSTDGTKLILTYDDPLSANTVSSSAYTISVDGVDVRLLKAAVVGSTVELNLATGLALGQLVRVAYTAPAMTLSTNNDAVQDAAGNNVASLSPFSIINKVIAPVPTRPVLLDDTVLSGDNITKLTKPTFTGKANLGATVFLYLGGTVLIGSGQADGVTGVWSITATTALPSNTASTITAKQLSGVNVLSADSAALIVTVDAVANAPVVVTSGSTGAAQPILAGTGEAGAMVKVFDNGSAVGTALVKADNTWSFQATGDGFKGGTSHNITTTQTDRAGNVSANSSAYSFTVVAPTSAMGTPALVSTGTQASDSGTLGDGRTNVSTPTFTGYATANATVTLYQGGTTVLGTGMADSGGKWTITSNSSLSGGMVYSITARDSATNFTSSSLNVTVDKVASVPVIQTLPTIQSNALIAGTAEAGATVMVTTRSNDGSSSKVMTTIANANGEWTLDFFSYSTGATFANGVYSLTAMQIDVAGNASAESQSQTLNYDSSANPPVVNALSAVSNAASMTISGTAEAGAVVRLYDGKVLLGIVTANALDGGWTYANMSLADGVHDISATQTDLAGNTSMSASTQTVTVYAPSKINVLSGSAVMQDFAAPSSTTSNLLVSTGGAATTSKLLALNGADMAIDTTWLTSIGGWTRSSNGQYQKMGIYGKATLDVGAKTLSYTVDPSLKANAGLLKGTTAQDVFTLGAKKSTEVVTTTTYVSFDVRGTKNEAFEGYDILIIAGQSNTDVLTNPADLNDVKNSDIFIARTALNQSWSNIGYFSTEMADAISVAFARRYVATQLAPDRKLLIINAGVGGTGFQAVNNGTVDWDAGTGQYSQQLISLVNQVMSSNRSNKVVGMLWQQGENNGIVSSITGNTVLDKNGYTKAWLDMVNDYQTNMTGFSGDTPIFVGQAVPDWILSSALDSTRPGALAVDDAQRNLGTQRDNTYYVAADGTNGLYTINSFNPSGNLIHYGSSLLDLGDRYFDTYQQYLTSKNAYLAPVRMLVGVDNVLIASELGASNVVAKFVADVIGYVQLYIDGQAVGARQPISGQQASFTLLSADVGSDGFKHLTLKVFDMQTAGHALSGLLDGAVVQVSTSQAHWAAAAQALWLNPDTIMTGISQSAIDGTNVTWTPSAGGTTAVRNVAGDAVQARLYVDGVNGHNVVGLTQGGLYLNASDITALMPNATGSTTGANPITMMVAATSNTAALSTSTTQAQVLSYGTSVANAGVFLGATLTPVLTGNIYTETGTKANDFGGVQGAAAATTGTATLPNNWDVMSLTTLGTTGTNYVTSVSADGSPTATSTSTASSINFTSSRNQLVIGKAVGGALGGTATSWDGDIGDVVVSGQVLSVAQRQEIQTYLSEKYDTTATKPTLVSQTSDTSGSVFAQSMDLSSSTVTNKIIDQLYISDEDSRADNVKVAGADYVRTGAGNDVVELLDLNFRQLDGGAGIDILKINAAISSIDLTQLVSNSRSNTTVGVGEGGTGTGGWHKLYSFEQIDLTNSGLTVLNLKMADVMELSDTKTLLIRGDNTTNIDAVTLLTGETWTPDAFNGTWGQTLTDASGATVYAHKFTSATATLWVEDGLKLAYNGNAAVVL
jgi:VCBS repeat-containing protein